MFCGIKGKTGWLSKKNEEEEYVNLINKAISSDDSHIGDKCKKTQKYDKEIVNNITEDVYKQL